MNAEVLPTFAARGAFYDLTAIASKDKATGDYWPELLELSKYKGKLHGLPKDYSPHVIFVNEGAPASIATRVSRSQRCASHQGKVCRTSRAVWS